MDLRLVEIFCAVFEERSFSKAAKRLGLSQPTISGHIKALEGTLDTRVFDRLGREIQPTRAGELLYEYGRQITELKESAEQAMARFLNRLEGRLLLGASTIPGEYLLPEHIGAFSSLFPKIEVEVEIHDTRSIVDAVKEGRYDIGFVGARLPDEGLLFEPFASDELILAAPATPAWRSSEGAMPFETLRRKPLLVRERGSGTRMMLERVLERHNMRLGELKVVAALGSTTAIKEGIKARLGGSFLSSIAVEEEIGQGTFREVRVRGLERIKREFFTVIHSRRAASPLRAAFLEFLASRLRGGGLQSDIRNHSMLRSIRV